MRNNQIKEEQELKLKKEEFEYRKIFDKKTFIKDIILTIISLTGTIFIPVCSLQYARFKDKQNLELQKEQ